MDDIDLCQLCAAVRLLRNDRSWQCVASTTQVCEPEIHQLYDISEYASLLFLFSTSVTLQALAYNLERGSNLIIDVYLIAIRVACEEILEVRER